MLLEEWDLVFGCLRLSNLSCICSVFPSYVDCGSWSVFRSSKPLLSVYYHHVNKLHISLSCWPLMKCCVKLQSTFHPQRIKVTQSTLSELCTLRIPKSSLWHSQSVCTLRVSEWPPRFPDVRKVFVTRLGSADSSCQIERKLFQEHCTVALLASFSFPVFTFSVWYYPPLSLILSFWS